MGSWGALRQPRGKKLWLLFYDLNAQEVPLEEVMANGQEGEGVVGGSAFYSYAVLSAGSPQVLKKTRELSIVRHRPTSWERRPWEEGRVPHRRWVPRGEIFFFRQHLDNWLKGHATKGRGQLKKNVFFRALPEFVRTLEEDWAIWTLVISHRYRWAMDILTNVISNYV